jgi:hypothetical protein
MNWRSQLRNERGVALPLAMIVLVVLTMMALAFMTLGAVEPQISRNLSDGARARQLAEAGIELAFTKLANQDFSVLLAGSTAVSGSSPTEYILVAGGTTLPGLSASQGTFGVTVRNDITSGDEKFTGYIPPGGTTQSLDIGGTATNDLNGILIVKSIGTFNGATRTVNSVIQRGKLNINAALSLPGAQADTFTDPPGAYSIDGRDWLRTDVTAPSTCLASCSQMKLGIATQPGTQSNLGQSYEVVAESGFDTAAKQGYVQGRHQSSGGLTTGVNTIASDTGLSPDIMQAFLTNLASNTSTQVIQSNQACAYPASGGVRNKPEGLRMTSTSSPGQVNVTNNCTGSQQINQAVNLGTATNPAIVYVKGEYDTTSQFVGLAAEGGQSIQGYGVLVVEDADMSFFGSNFRWDGIVVITGRYVGVGFRGGSNTEIRGALIANETVAGEAGGFFEFLNQGSATSIRRSKQNIDMALNALYNMRISAYREN